MRRRRTASESGSLSFLDIISCGFGAVIMLLLISKTGVSDGGGGDVRALLRSTFASEAAVQRLSRERVRLEAELAALRAENRMASGALSEDALRHAREQQELEELRDKAEGLELAKESLERASISQGEATERDIEVGGIPVDSEYVIFLVDTSGSMKNIWSRVIREIENVLDIHPKVLGFQVLNDNGSYLMRSYRRKWIPDTPARRQGALKLLRTWGAGSNSSPVEGLEVALQHYAKPGQKVAIYLFGDDYSGGSYDNVIRVLDRLNRDHATKKPIIKVHAVGFLYPAGSTRFSTLMREVTHRNNGAFLGLPVR